MDPYRRMLLGLIGFVSVMLAGALIGFWLSFRPQVVDPASMRERPHIIPTPFPTATLLVIHRIFPTSPLHLAPSNPLLSLIPYPGGINAKSEDGGVPSTPVNWPSERRRISFETTDRREDVLAYYERVLRDYHAYGVPKYGKWAVPNGFIFAWGVATNLPRELTVKVTAKTGQPGRTLVEIEIIKIGDLYW